MTKAAFRVTGVPEDFIQLAGRLHSAERPLQRNVTRGLRDVAKTVETLMRDGGAAGMPSGLAPIILSGTRATVTVSNAGRGGSVAVDIDLSLPGYEVGAWNRGILHHPTFGRAPWVTQLVQAGAFTDPVERAAPELKAELEQEVARTLNEIGG